MMGGGFKYIDGSIESVEIEKEENNFTKRITFHILTNNKNYVMSKTKTLQFLLIKSKSSSVYLLIISFILFFSLVLLYLRRVRYDVPVWFPTKP